MQIKTKVVVHHKWSVISRIKWTKLYPLIAYFIQFSSRIKPNDPNIKGCFICLILINTISQRVISHSSCYTSAVIVFALSVATLMITDIINWFNVLWILIKFMNFMIALFLMRNEYFCFVLLSFGFYFE